MAAVTVEKGKPMILVRNIFRCRFSKGGEVARLIQETRAQWGPVGRLPMRVLTDLDGPFDTVVTETVIESIDEYNRLLRERFADADVARLLAPLADFVESGRREYFTIETDDQGSVSDR
jgi:hypothetical protein